MPCDEICGRGDVKCERYLPSLIEQGFRVICHIDSLSFIVSRVPIHSPIGRWAPNVFASRFRTFSRVSPSRLHGVRRVYTMRKTRRCGSWPWQNICVLDVRLFFLSTFRQKNVLREFRRCQVGGMAIWRVISATTVRMCRIFVNVSKLLS